MPQPNHDGMISGRSVWDPVGVGTIVGCRSDPAVARDRDHKGARALGTDAPLSTVPSGGVTAGRGTNRGSRGQLGSGEAPHTEVELAGPKTAPGLVHHHGDFTDRQHDGLHQPVTGSPGGSKLKGGGATVDWAAGSGSGSGGVVGRHGTAEDVAILRGSGSGVVHRYARCSPLPLAGPCHRGKKTFMRNALCNMLVETGWTVATDFKRRQTVTVTCSLIPPCSRSHPNALPLAEPGCGHA